MSIIPIGHGSRIFPKQKSIEVANAVTIGICGLLDNSPKNN